MVGTSTKWDGPRAGGWSTAARPLRRLERIPETNSDPHADTDYDQVGKPDITGNHPDTDQAADRYWHALRDDVIEDADAYGLRIAMNTTGARLVDTLAELGEAGLDALGPLAGDTPEDRVDLFIARFVQRVASVGGRPVDAALRRSVTLSAIKLLDADPRLADAIKRGDTSSDWKLGSDLLCLIYEFFFKQPVAQFIKAVVTGKIVALFPPIHLIDPANKIADWISGKITALIPNPCAEKHEKADDGGTVADLARSLVQETVQRILGLPTGVSTEAA